MGTACKQELKHLKVTRRFKCVEASGLFNINTISVKNYQIIFIAVLGAFWEKNYIDKLEGVQRATIKMSEWVEEAGSRLCAS